MKKRIRHSIVNLELLIESKSYKVPKCITIQYALAESIRIDSYSVKSDGLELCNAIDLADSMQRINLSLQKDKGSIAITFNLSNSTQETVNLYAVSSSKGVYLSQRSYEHAERMRMQNELTKDDYLQESLGSQGISITAEREKTRAEKKAKVEGLKKLSTYRLNLEWTDSAGKTHPTRRTEIIVYYYATNSAKEVARGYTDNNGNFAFTADIDDRRLTVLAVNSATSCCNVSNTLKKTPYSYYIQYVPKYSKYVIPKSAGTPNPNNATNVQRTNEVIHAIQISQAITFGYDYVNVMSNGTFKQKTIQVEYPNGKDGSYYSSNTNGLYIAENAYLCWDIILHEFGHLLQKEYGIANSPGGDHYIDNDLIADRKNKDVGIRLAWGEAWPTTFAIMVSQYFNLKDYPRVADTDYHANNGRENPMDFWTKSLEQNRSNPVGEGCEKDVFCLLYDMYDAKDKQDEDNMALSHKVLWDLITSSKSKTLSQFVNYAYNHNYNIPDLYQILSAHGVSGKILSHNVLQLIFQVGGNPNCKSSLQNKATVYFSNYYTCNIYKTVTNDKLTFDSNNKNQSYVYLPRKEMYEDPGAYMSCCLGTWQTDSPQTGAYFSPWKVLEKHRQISGYRPKTNQLVYNSFFFPTDDFSFLNKRVQQWNNETVQINNKSFTIGGLNALYCKPYILMNTPGTNGNASISLAGEPIYAVKFSVFVDIPKGYTDKMIGANVYVSVAGIANDNRAVQLLTSCILGNSNKERKDNIVLHQVLKNFGNATYLKQVTISIVTMNCNSTLGSKVQVKLGNILLSQMPDLPEFF